MSAAPATQRRGNMSAERSTVNALDEPAFRYSRRGFLNLPPFASATDAVRAALADLGKPGGLLDANDDLSKGPVLLITDLGLSANNPNNPTHTAGTTFIGQFIDHDITFDTTSRLG